MKTSRERLIAWGVCLTLSVLLVGPWWTTRVRANPGGQTAPTVRQAPVGQRLGSRPGERGATYYALEAQTARSPCALPMRWQSGNGPSKAI
jgi:hypothetical protein